MKPPGTNAGSGSISRLAPQFADRQPRIPQPSVPDASNVQNSNRECLRLETGVTQTKQRIAIGSNREKEASFFGPSRGGCFSPPAVRPRCRRRLEQFAKHKIPTAAAPKTRKTRTRDPQLLFRLGKIRSLIPFNLRRNLIEPMFRVERVAERRKIKASAGLAHRDASRGNEEKTNSRPTTFVAIRRSYIIDFIRLTGNFNLTMLRLDEETEEPSSTATPGCVGLSDSRGSGLMNQPGKLNVGCKPAVVRDGHSQEWLCYQTESSRRTGVDLHRPAEFHRARRVDVPAAVAQTQPSNCNPSRSKFERETPRGGNPLRRNTDCGTLRRNQSETYGD